MAAWIWEFALCNGAKKSPPYINMIAVHFGSGNLTVSCQNTLISLMLMMIKGNVQYIPFRQITLHEYPSYVMTMHYML